MKREIFILSFLTAVMGLMAGCGGGSSNNSAPAVTYSMVGTTCYNSANQPVANTYCTGATTSGYYVQNGACYNGSAQVVPMSYCPIGTGYPSYGYTYPNYYPPPPPPPYYYRPYQSGGFYLFYGG